MLSECLSNVVSRLSRLSAIFFAAMKGAIVVQIPAGRGERHLRLRGWVTVDGLFYPLVI